MKLDGTNLAEELKQERAARVAAEAEVSRLANARAADEIAQARSWEAEVARHREQAEGLVARAEAAERRVEELEAIIRATEGNYCEEHGSADDDDGGGERLTPTCSICALLLEAEKIGAKAKRRALRDGGKGEG